MHDKAQDDERVMTLVELALSRPSGERERFLRSACGRNTELFGQAWDYVKWEERMDGFLLDPVLAPLRERPFEPGELLEGRFRILREVAQGGMGVVYEAVDEKLDRRIALKCAKAGFGSSLSPEARNATTISHPNGCKIFEIHTASTAQGKVDFLTMEFLDGETLAARLQRGPFPEHEARSLALQLCAGLAEAHRNSVIHGDLKTANVILCRAADQAPRAVITDFGLARRPDTTLRSLQSGQVRGTPAYMAPELWKGEKATVASDIYALGVILLELIGGKRVAEEGEPGALPRPWKRVVARCLDADPARRFQSAGEVAQALRPVSRRWLLAAAAATVLAIASGAVTYQRATAPAESFTLAVLPLETAPDAAALGSSVSQAAAAQIERLRGGTRARLKVITLEQARRKAVGTAAAARSVLGATHVFRGTLERHEGKVVLHAFVTDTGAHAATRQQ